jgi:hypothetical protein
MLPDLGEEHAPTSYVPRVLKRFLSVEILVSVQMYRNLGAVEEGPKH